MTRTKMMLLAPGVLLAASLACGSASAMPLGGGLATAVSEASDVQQVRWVCGPFRCFWRPNYYPYHDGYAWGGPRFYGRPWGGRPYYRRPWWGGRGWY